MTVKEITDKRYRGDLSVTEIFEGFCILTSFSSSRFEEYSYLIERKGCSHCVPRKMNVEVADTKMHLENRQYFRYRR